VNVAEIAAIGQFPEISAQQVQISSLPQKSFASVLAQSVDQVNGSLLRADAMLAQAAVDGSQPPHQVMLALEEARLSFQLALQIRNRVLESYQELMRMQV
jgi:flagellar hook-basal body complex protein FliE